MSKFMKSNISVLLFLITLCFVINLHAEETSRERLVRNAILDNGFKYSRDLYLEKDSHLSAEGKVFFESKHLSLNGEIACATCHISKMGSTDGIPNAAGVRGRGEGAQALGLWGEDSSS